MLGLLGVIAIRIGENIYKVGVWFRIRVIPVVGTWREKDPRPGI